MDRLRRVFVGLLGFALLAAATAAAAAPRSDDEDDASPRAVYDFADDFAMGEMSASPGGAQDIAFFRDRVRDGEIPHPAVFTPEGLFSEHDLPAAKGARCGHLLCPRGQAIDARLLVQPEVRHLAQIGFATNIDAGKFRRAPMDLVAVVDVSGSMTGVLPLVRASLLEVLRQLDADDRLGIVIYGDRAQVLLPPTSVDGIARGRIERAIGRLAAGGSTAMEDGLRTGYRVAARHSGRGRISRLMLFTDERPNVGASDAGSFMALARAGAREGTGLTTIGVGVQFGAELATAVSSVRGGNLFFFPHESAMLVKFEEELDTMVTELAHDVRLEIRPALGLRIAGIFGIPGEMARWTEGGGLEVEVETLFASRKGGAIFFALASDGKGALPTAKTPDGGTIATVQLDYSPVRGKRRSTGVAVTKVARARASAGLVRGALLVDEATALAEATRMHHEANDQEGAYQLVHALAGRFRRLPDATLTGERTLVLKLEETLAHLSGHAGEPAPGDGGRAPSRPGRHRVTGLPPR